MLRFSFELLRCRKAATAVEYGLIVSLIVIGMLAGLSAMSVETGGLWGRIANKVETAR